MDHSLELSIAKLLEQGRKARAGLEAVAHQVVAVQERGGLIGPVGCDSR